MRFKNLAFPLPPGLKVEKSKGVVVMSAKIPIEKSMPRLAETMEMSMDMLARGKPNPQGAEVEMEMHMNKVGKFQFRFKK